MSYPKLTPIVATGASAPRYIGDRFSDLTNVKDFGATGDGTTDDTAAFLAAAEVGKNLFCPNGRYVVNTQLDTTAYGLDFVLLGNNNIKTSYIHSSDGASAAFKSLENLISSVRYNLDESKGSFTLLPSRTVPHGVIIKFGKNYGSGIRIEFDEPFPNKCFGVICSILPNLNSLEALSIVRPYDVDKSGFTAVTRYYKPSDGETGVAGETYYWLAVGY